MKKKDLQLSIGEMLRIYRRRFNIAAWKIAKKLDVGTATYYAIERGEVMPTKAQYENMPKDIEVAEKQLTPGERLSLHIWRRGGLQKFCRKHDLNYTRISAICNGAVPYEAERTKLEAIIKELKGEW